MHSGLRCYRVQLCGLLLTSEGSLYSQQTGRNKRRVFCREEGRMKSEMVLIFGLHDFRGLFQPMVV